MGRRRGEFERIELFTRGFPPPPPGVRLGIGDDCAVLRSSPGQDLVVTTDSLVQDVHFTRQRFTLQDVGHKALAVNLSDLAAMGARPTWFLCALELPDWVDDRGLRALADGMRRLAARVQISLVGGNLARAPVLGVTLTAAGQVPQGRALLRSTASPGDKLYVSGTVGDARFGLEHHAPPGPLLRQRRPQPRLALGILARRFASAAVDISDGFAQDLEHLCRASAVGARVELPLLPVSGALLRHAGVEAPLWAARGGEDYELLLCIPPKKVRAFERACHKVGQKVTCVGEITAPPRVILLDAHGREPTGLRGFDHFAPRRSLHRRSAGGRA
jgi:thiamine-monophosphate kinase